MSYFHRDGRQASSEEIAKSRKLSAVSIGYDKRKTCGRCGGAGGSDKWAHTGWTCYDCGGNGLGNGYYTIKLYTADKLAALNASKAKRDAKRAEAFEVTRLQCIREARARRRVNATDVCKFVRLAWASRRRFPIFNDILRTVLKTGRVSSGQFALVERKLAETAKRESSKHIGAKGERIQITLTLKDRRIVGYSKHEWGRFAPAEIVLATFEDEDGNIVKTFNQVPREFTEWDKEAEMYKSTGKPVTVRATIKSHDDYKGVLSTMITRISTKGVK